ncbi:MAG: hypothetical protein CMF41_03225 [Legionellales bacterium]|nr:hypothetical protein [Legionellales bacterium]|tara:strand:+ start:2658 stop:3113 length:456 start_codon:yes stop_codon:yes gene_type:complete
MQLVNGNIINYPRRPFFTKEIYNIVYFFNSISILYKDIPFETNVMFAHLLIILGLCGILLFLFLVLLRCMLDLCALKKEEKNNIELHIEIENTVPLTTYDVECPICLEKPCNIAAPCTHKFHEKCLYQWFKTNNFTCPICRIDLSKYDYKN